jgi:predicted nucleic acid-binding protein
MIFVDTDVMVDILREYPPALHWLASLADEEIVLSGFVVLELLQGCNNNREVKLLERKLENYHIVWLSNTDFNIVLSTFAKYYLSNGIGIIDTIISQTAISLNTILHTFNQKHYEAIPHLKCTQPYSRKK